MFIVVPGWIWLEGVSAAAALGGVFLIGVVTGTCSR